MGGREELTWTAEMTLSHLAHGGDRDAAALFERLGLDQERIVDSPATILSPEYRLTRTVFLHLRQQAMDALCELTEASLFVDVPCGLSPRGLRFVRGGRPYLGVDLPPVIQRIEAAALSLLRAEERPFLRYTAADATDPDALLSALTEGPNGGPGAGNGPLCILTEGLLMYLSQAETERFCRGIGRMLSLTDGYWISADPEMPVHMHLLYKAICLDGFSQAARRGIVRKPVPGRQLPARPSEPSPLQIELRGDIREQIERGKAFLSRFGLQAERIPMSALLPEPTLPAGLSPPQAEAVRETLQSTCCYVMTLA